MSFNLGTSSNATCDIVSARQAERVAFLHRTPFVFDGLALGFLPNLGRAVDYQAARYLNESIIELFARFDFGPTVDEPTGKYVCVLTAGVPASFR